MDVQENERIINPDLEELTYNGRIDFSEPTAPIFVFPGSSVSMIFRGTKLKLLIKNNHGFNDNYIGYILDGIQKKVLLLNGGNIQEITLAENLQEDKSHEIILFKRQDACHEFTFYGFTLSGEGRIISPPKRSRKYIEFYGDSAAAGEHVESRDYKSLPTQKHNGEYSNAWYSYAMITARNLKVNVSIVAQGGISLLDNAGYFRVPDSIGMESIYDKLHFNPDLGRVTDWDFKRYSPQVVVIDIGQYDSYPEDYMRKDKNGEKAKRWKKHYKEFILSIRSKYPKAFIILSTTKMQHHPSWDRAVGLVCDEIRDEKILHFIYNFNGRGISSYINLAEAEQMAFELSIFLNSLGPQIWE